MFDLTFMCDKFLMTLVCVFWVWWVIFCVLSIVCYHCCVCYQLAEDNCQCSRLCCSIIVRLLAQLCNLLAIWLLYNITYRSSTGYEHKSWAISLLASATTSSASHFPVHQHVVAIMCYYQICVFWVFIWVIPYKSTEKNMTIFFF